MQKRRMIVAITGASGAILGIRLIEELHRAGVEVHLIISDWGQRTISLETDYTVEQVCALADTVYPADDLAAAVSSGSFPVDGMIVIPCSMKTLAGIANGFSSNLIERAADVTLKERRPLLLVPRESPVSRIHLRNMLTLSEMGVIIQPPCVEFYTRPESLTDMIDYLVGKTMDELKIEHELFVPWGGSE